ncbi:MAG TPA: amidohydrolase family protein [Bryobacteraceae bacterium]|nr:amidohydrolase family protein [Bryobacteraceae bacterium]
MYKNWGVCILMIRKISQNLLLLTATLGLCWSQAQQPKLIDCHVHHNGSNEFLEKLVAKLEPLQGMAMLITAPKDLDSVTAFMKTHPNRLIGLGEIQLDAPDALDAIDRFHNAGFRGLGEMSKPQYPYDDRRYWPIYERAEKYGMVLLFHTGIVNRTNPQIPADVSSDRMRVSTLDLIARRFPKLTIIGAHLGNPDYAWAAEIGRWNPNVYFDVSGSTLIKKQADYPFFKSIFWWTSVASPHTPKSNTTAFEKLVFGSDVFEGDLDELDRELERYHRLLDECGVPAEAQANIFSGTLWRILNR